MDDLISRQAAIDALNDEFTIIGKTNAVIVQDYIRRVNNRLRSLPSAQPERKMNRMDDLISKASVCEILADIYPTDGEKVVAVKEIDKAYETILNLPYAERRGSWVGIDDEPCEVWECDQCGHIVERECPPRFCEKCGARMEGELE